MSRVRRRRGRCTRCSTSAPSSRWVSGIRMGVYHPLVTVQATPNLRVINMWGVSFVDDAHIEAFSSNCIQLAVLCVSYCPKVPQKQAFTL